tara:strand:+ start:1809 stop:2006 length:198 start_codon:yes stop_codon:yes gene_type:complete
MTDLKIFQQTSDKSYDRHTYEIFLKSGQKVKFKWYDDAREYWFTHNQIPNYLDFIVVKDKKGKGF